MGKVKLSKVSPEVRAIEKDKVTISVVVVVVLVVDVVEAVEVGEVVVDARVGTDSQKHN